MDAVQAISAILPQIMNLILMIVMLKMVLGILKGGI